MTCNSCMDQLCHEVSIQLSSQSYDLHHQNNPMLPLVQLVRSPVESEANPVLSGPYEITPDAVLFMTPISTFIRMILGE